MVSSSAQAVPSGSTPAAGEKRRGVASTEKLHGYEWFRSIGSPRMWVAPMVDQSELPFRLLCQRHGATGAYTPMLHAALFCGSERYREDHFSTCAEEGPLLAQFCANDPAVLLKAARHVEGRCNAVDINFGCPQGIAKRGNYGSFLMEQPELQVSLVRTLHENLGVPVTAKIRCFPDVDATVAYAKRLEAAGASMLGVHGRTRAMKGSAFGMADWGQIAAVKRAVSIPVIANGNIGRFEDVQACLDATGADGVMSAECLLWNPGLFAGPLADPSRPDLLSLCEEYLDLAEKYPVHPRMVRTHVFRMLNDYLPLYPEIRAELLEYRGSPEQDKAAKRGEFAAIIPGQVAHLRAKVVGALREVSRRDGDRRITAKEPGQYEADLDASIRQITGEDDHYLQEKRHLGELPGADKNGGPPLQNLRKAKRLDVPGRNDTRIRVRWDQKQDEHDSESIRGLFSNHGEVDTVIFQLRRKKDRVLREQKAIVSFKDKAAVHKIVRDKPRFGSMQLFVYSGDEDAKAKGLPEGQLWVNVQGEKFVPGTGQPGGGERLGFLEMSRSTSA